MAYVYRHIRLDKNEPFYIGIGSDEKFSRAHSKHQRNKKWYNIIAKTDYKVQVVLMDISLEEAKEKEVEFIKLYGRSDKSEGTLCNLTDGGEGNPGRIVSDEWRKKQSMKIKGRKMSEEFKQKRREYMTGRKMPEECRQNHIERMRTSHPMRGKKMSDEARKNISEGHKGIFSGDKHPNWGKFGAENPLSKKVICTVTNKIYHSAREAANALGIAYTTMRNQLNGQKKNNTTLIYLKNKQTSI
jgi:hypothetical protein